MHLYLATANPAKIVELSSVLREAQLVVKVSSPEELGGMPSVIEDGDTFFANARKKAQALMAVVPSGSMVLADDSGLEVDILRGAPGVRSARYAGEHAAAGENNRKLLKALAPYASEHRSARFICCIVIIEPSGCEQSFSDACEGVIASSPAGEEGFGYDPIFIPEGFENTFAELGAAIKRHASHRARALNQLIHWFRFKQTAFGALV